MHLHLILLVLFAATGLAHPAHDGETIQEFEEEFHQKIFPAENEKKAADELAKEEASIEKDNELYDEGLSTWKEKINELSDMSKEEVEKEKEGALDISTHRFAMGAFDLTEEDRYLSPDEQARLDSIYDELSRASIPDEYNAVTAGIITEAKSQGSCGSCAAFAATTVHETCLIKAGTPFNGVNVAEQQLVDCGYNGYSMNGCNGANTGSYVQWMVDTAKGQVNHEANYPYLDREPNLKCQDRPFWNAGSIVSASVIDWWCDEEKMKGLVYRYGAVATHIYASDSGFGNYASGVFNGCTSNSINHAVVVVGYGTENGNDYWLVKNSWGSNWGDNGYIKMFRGNGICGIGGLCVAAECTDTGNASPAPVAPPPPPVPASQICDVRCAFGPNLTGSYTIRWGSFTSSVKCENGMCSPRVAGPSNACMYMCGRVECCA